MTQKHSLLTTWSSLLANVARRLRSGTSMFLHRQCMFDKVKMELELTTFDSTSTIDELKETIKAVECHSRVYDAVHAVSLNWSREAMNPVPLFTWPLS
jgi:hypothetical protein